jgi:DNA polymerase-3 subunit epsilon
MSCYLSIDLEATGLLSQDYVIEFAAVPFNVHSGLEKSLAFHCYVQCPSFEELKPSLNPWVIEHNAQLIQKAHKEGISISDWRIKLESYLAKPEVLAFFQGKPAVIFGKSLNALDMPLMKRDLGYDWMQQKFSHRTHDFTSVCYAFMDLGLLPQGMERGSQIMEYLGYGQVAHTALEDAVNTAQMYLDVLRKLKPLH